MTAILRSVDLVLENVVREFPIDVLALAGVSLTIPAGQSVAILGASGSGKSTLLGVLGLLDAPSSGRYLLNDRNTAGASEFDRTTLRAQTFGFVFQSFNLIPHLTALENVELGLTSARAPVGARKEKAADILSAVGLERRAAFRPQKLSGGEQQRVAIARALVRDPAVLLCDEPTGNLDSRTSDAVLDLIFASKSDRRTTVIVTHNEAIAQRCDRTIRMSDGQISSDSGGGG